MSRFGISITDAQQPVEPFGQWTVGVYRRKIEELQKNNDEVRLARFLLVTQTVQFPLSIRQGWTRLDRDDCFVYISRPGTDHRSRSIQTPAPPNHLFLVFVLPDGTIDYWGWRPAKCDEPDSPEGVEGKILWPPPT